MVRFMVEVKLKVEDGKQRDVARGVARIDEGAMQKLGVSAGDVIEIIGKKRTSAIAWPAYSEDQDRGIIRIDRFVRKNAGTSINKYIMVRRADVKNASSIVLAPDMKLNVDEDFTNFVKNRLRERTFVEGDTTLVIMHGHPVQFTVVNTNPEAGIVRMVHETNFQILRRDSLSFRAPKRDGIWRGIAFDQENVVKFVVGIDTIVDNDVNFGLVVEKKVLGVKVFDAFNQIFSKYVKDIKIEAAGHEVTKHYGKPQFVGDIIFKKSAFHSLGLSIEKVSWEWKVCGEDRDRVIEDIERLLKKGFIP